MTTPTTGSTPPSQDISVSDDDDSTDQHGIPTSMKHASQNAFTLVWSFMHKLAVPIPDPVQPGRPFTHVCLSDPDALTRAECELQLQHDDIYIKLAQRDVSIGDVLDTAPDATPTFMAPHRTINSSSSSLLDVEVLTETDEVRSAHDDFHLKARNIWNQWKKLSVKWSCTSKDGKYNLLHLYREVDVHVLAWFSKHGERDFPSIAILARIYLGKPLSTAPQERFFSQSGYVVNELRTRLDDDRAEQLCLLRANWSEYKQF